MTTNDANDSETATSPRPSRWPWVVVVAICTLHSVGAWFAMGGWSGVTGPAPLAIHDHPIQEHNAWVTRPLLLQKGLASGYDPYFMAGYPKSLISSPSSTMFEVAGFLTGGRAPAVVYKMTIFLALAALPWLLAWAGRMLRSGAAATSSGVGLFLVYVWTDGAGGGFPLNYALFGTTAYLVSVPLGLVVTAALCRFLIRGGFLRWVALTALASLCFLVHVTSVLFLVPAALLSFLVAMRTGRSWGLKGFTALEMSALVVVALNAFWWLPAYWLRGTKVESIAFLTNSDESVWWRVARIGISERPIQAVILGLGLIGLAVLSQRDRIAAAGLAGFTGAGLFFGYLAAFFPKLDFLQPGRQTHTLYTGAALLAGIGLAAIIARLGTLGSRRIRIATLLGLTLIGGRLFGNDVVTSVRYRLGRLPGVATRPFLASTPAPHLATIVTWVRESMKPGERLFYEEVARDLPGLDPDPFHGGRYSGLLPQMTGIEVIGGFYLHAGINTNFTQIGEGKLFGETGWTREQFIRYAKLYRPSAIICWSADAKRFCLENSDLIEITLREGRLLAGRVKGFAGTTIRGRANVEAEAGRLRVKGMVPDLDGLVVLRYHHAPGLRSQPPVRLEPVFLEKDPVPFIGLRPDSGQSDAILDLTFPPGR